MANLIKSDESKRVERASWIVDCGPARPHDLGGRRAWGELGGFSSFWWLFLEKKKAWDVQSCGLFWISGPRDGVGWGESMCLLAGGRLWVVIGLVISSRYNWIVSLWTIGALCDLWHNSLPKWLRLGNMSPWGWRSPYVMVLGNNAISPAWPVHMVSGPVTHKWGRLLETLTGGSVFKATE